MIRKIIQIDQEKCNGCGLCVSACHEGAIGLAEGKAVLLRDDYCDGLGDCLPACPTGAITFTEREAAAYDEKAVRKNKGDKAARDAEEERIENRMENRSPGVSRLRQWPVQIKLAPLTAPYFQNSALLIAADCTAYAYGNFHEDFIRDRAVLVGCPKLDNVDYSEKLTEILKQNDIKNLTVVRMEVPCCRGIERAVAAALEKSGKALPVRTVVVGTDGSLCQTLAAAV